MAELPPQHWAFLANPKIYDIERAVGSLKEDTWRVKSIDIHRGDRIVIWKAKGGGKDRGVIALATAIDEPFEGLPDPMNQQFWMSGTGKSEIVRRIRIRYEVPPGLPMWISECPEILDSLSVAKARGSTAFRLTDEQFSRIEIASRSVRPPKASQDAVPTRSTKVLWSIGREHIEQAVQRFTEYGGHRFKDSTKFDVSIDGVRYPPKALLAFAAKIGLNIDLTPDDFSGGEDSTCFRVLRKHGFHIVPKALALVIACNEVSAVDHDYQDVVGELCHFPNQYKNLMVPGRRFVYYRGKRRANGEIGVPEYFGTGTVAEVSLDSHSVDAKSTRWYAVLDDFVEFKKPVPCTTDGIKIEMIPKNLFGVGVRAVPLEIYTEILSRAGVSLDSGDGSEKPPVELPPIDRQEASLAERSLIKRRVVLPKGDINEGSGRSSRMGIRRSRYAKQIGDRGEELVLKYLMKHGNSEGIEIRWNANEGDCPGWDLEFGGGENAQYVEVKSTVANDFSSIDISINEWRAAERHRSRYWLALVAQCRSLRPSIQWIQDPFGKLISEKLRIEPIMMQISFTEDMPSVTPQVHK